MSFFKPNYFFDKVWDISPEFLNKNNIKCVLLDVDNTLTTHDNPNPHEMAVSWLEAIKKTGIKPIIISNNIMPRVAPFAKTLDLECICHAQKPSSKGVKQAIKVTGISKKEMLIVGDQIFTDVLCGKFSGVRTVLVTPFELEDMPFFKVKRFFENIILWKERKNK